MWIVASAAEFAMRAGGADALVDHLDAEIARSDGDLGGADRLIAVGTPGFHQVVAQVLPDDHEMSSRVT